MTITDKLTRAKSDYDEVYEAGKKSEYDRFWDSLQLNGTLTNYYGVFAGISWNKDTFKPKYKIIPAGVTSAMYMFLGFNSLSTSELIDYKEYEHLFDFSQATNMNCTFMDAGLDNLDLDCTNVTIFDQCFAEANFSSTKKTTISLKTSENVTSFLGTFSHCSALKNLIFKEGSIIPVNINTQYSPLTKESITSVINALSSSASGKTATFKKSAKEKAFTDEEWAALIATKPNWTITLV